MHVAHRYNHMSNMGLGDIVHPEGYKEGDSKEFRIQSLLKGNNLLIFINTWSSVALKQDGADYFSIVRLKLDQKMQEAMAGCTKS